MSQLDRIEEKMAEYQEYLMTLADLIGIDLEFEMQCRRRKRRPRNAPMTQRSNAPRPPS